MLVYLSHGQNKSEKVFSIVKECEVENLQKISQSFSFNES